MVFIKKLKWLIGNSDRLPQLTPDQILKLKQLTVLTLAETYKVEYFILPSVFSHHMSFSIKGGQGNQLFP